jgi:hypothetical protein
MRAATPFVGAEHKAVKQLSTLFRLFEYFKPYQKQIPIALMFVLYGSATQAIGLFLIGRSIDRLVRNGNVTELMMSVRLTRHSGKQQRKLPMFTSLSSSYPKDIERYWANRERISARDSDN